VSQPASAANADSNPNTSQPFRNRRPRPRRRWKPDTPPTITPGKNKTATDFGIPDPGPTRLPATVGGETVSVEVCTASFPLACTLAGEKLQTSVVGSPEQLNVTVPVNPFVGVTVNVTAVSLTGITRIVAELAAIVNPEAKVAVDVE
jgi:hypothetical protein